MKLRLAIVICLFVAVPTFAQSVGACKIFPSNNPWNQRVDSLPVHPNSAKYVATVGGTVHLHPDFGSNAQYGIPWIAVNGSTPFVPITVTSGWGQEDPGPMPIPPNAKVEYPAPPGGDAHVLVVDTTNHQLYELYQGIKTSNGWSATTSAIFALDSNNYRPDGWTSCDAAGLPIFPGLVRLDECQAGEIKHAIRFTVQKSSKGWIFPGRHHAGSTTDTTNVMPMGLRMRLKASFDDSKYTGYAKVISTAMKKYGIIMADNGSNWYITGENNTNWPDNDISQLKSITGNDLEAVYTGPIRIKENQFPDPVLPIPSESGKGILTVSPSVIDFGNVDTGSFKSVNAWLFNKGNALLSIASKAVTGGLAFSVPLDKKLITIAPGDSAALFVTFAPKVAGQQSAVLNVSDGSEAPVSVDLKGNGTIPPLGGVAIGSADAALSMDVLPNPVSGTASVTFQVPGTADVSITLYDATGREVKRILNGERRTGQCDVSFSAADLPNGAYYLRLTTPVKTTTKTIEVLH